MLRIPEIIQKKRDGGELSRDEMEALVLGGLRGEVPDYQVSAWLMAVYFRGMTPQETTTLTSILQHSGRQLELPSLDKPILDKHSTGGVGDKTSLVVVPLLAALGIAVPKMSGRGLGFTGGTVDKLESIPGFRTDFTAEEIARLVEKVGACLVGQSPDMAPADKYLYALRDVTATVDCIPLIAASVMSKKLAGGADYILLDVKTGPGAFMPHLPDALELAPGIAAGVWCIVGAFRDAVCRTGSARSVVDRHGNLSLAGSAASAGMPERWQATGGLPRDGGGAGR